MCSSPVMRQVHALGLEDSKAPVPISVFWLVPQYFIIGAAEILVNIGTMELFYSEVRPCLAARAPADASDGTPEFD